MRMETKTANISFKQIMISFKRLTIAFKLYSKSFIRDVCLFDCHSNFLVPIFVLKEIFLPGFRDKPKQKTGQFNYSSFFILLLLFNISSDITARAQSV